MHKYKVDRMESQTFNILIVPLGYNNLKGKTTSYKKFWYLKMNKMICKY
jgi:hypothetical protein